MDERLCNTLQSILELELAAGNSIESIDAAAGTACPFAINLKHRINHQSVSEILLANTVEKWQNTDRHYPLQSGYKCTKYKHSIAGPS